MRPDSDDHDLAMQPAQPRCTLSIIVPCRNGAATIRRLIGALLDLELPRHWAAEVIVGYQASTDGTLDELRSLPVRIVESVSTGPSAARNSAAESASGEWLWFIDADAWPGDRRILQFLGRHLSRVENPGAIGGPIVLPPVQHSNPIAVADHFACWFNWLEHRRSAETALFQPSASVFVPRAVFQEVGGFDPRLRVLEDFDFQERIKAAGYRLFFFNELRVLHEARPTLLASWRHSWHWGIHFRTGFYDRVDFRIPWLVYSRRWFWLNLPLIFAIRLARVLVAGWMVSPLRLVYAFPFILATVLAWALGVVRGLE